MVASASALVSILQDIKDCPDYNFVLDISALAGQTVEIAEDIDFGNISVTFSNSGEAPVIFTGGGVLTFSGTVRMDGVVLPGLHLTSTGVYSEDSTATFSGRGIVRVVDEPQSINNGEVRVLAENQEWTAEGSQIGSAGGVDGGGLYGLSLHNPVDVSSADAPGAVLRHLAYLEIEGSQRNVSGSDAPAVARGGFAYGNVSLTDNGDVTITGNAATATAAASAVAQGGVVYGSLDITSGAGDPEDGETVIIAQNVAQGKAAAGGVLCGEAGKALTLIGGKTVLLAQNQALGTESAEGGVVAGGASIQASGIHHLEFNSNFAQSSGSALGGVLCGGNLGIADTAQVLFAGNAVAGATARGSVLYNAGLSIENVGITQFRGNYEYENGTLTLRSIYAQDGSAPGMTFNLQPGQTVLMYDSVYYGTTATGASLTLDGAGVLAFSAFCVASDLAGLRNGTAASAGEIMASSTSYVADTLVNGGTLMVGDGAIYTGTNMTVSANGSLALYAAQSSVSLSGSFVQEGSVVIDFSGMTAGEYQLLNYTSHTVGDGASIQAQNVADGLNCSISYTDTGIVATLTGEVLPHPDIRVVAASAEYTGLTNSGLVAVQITLQNYGNCATSEDSTLNIYLSANGKLDDNAVLASTVKLGSILGSLSQNTYNLGINISSLDLPLGNYSIIVKAVDPNEQAGTLQDNAASIGTLRYAPNVRVASAGTQYGELTTKGTLSVSFNLQNLGTAGTESQTTVRLYLTQNGVVDGNAISLGAVLVNTPPAGMEIQYTLNAKLAAVENVKAGAYTIVAVVSNPDEPTASAGDNASGIGALTLTRPVNEFVVTSLADSGEGTLRDAVAKANACPEDEDVVIRFADGLEGEIPLSGYIVAERNMTLVGNTAVSLAGDFGCLMVHSELVMNNMEIDGSVYLFPGAKLSGDGNTFASDTPIVLGGWGGATLDALGALANSTFVSQDARIRVSFSGSDVVLGKLPDGFPVYNLSGNVQDGQSLTIEEGVTVTEEVYVRNGGTLTMNGARVEGTVLLAPGAVLEGDGNTFASEIPVGLVDWSGSTSVVPDMLGNLTRTAFESGDARIRVSTLSGDTVLSALPEGFSAYDLGNPSSDYGLSDSLAVSSGQTLTVEDGVAITGKVTVQSGASLNMEGATCEAELAFAAGANAEVHNCDLSKAGIVISGTGSEDYTIDLSGNWWGTTDEAEIRAKIAGSYDPAHVILDGWLAGAPGELFEVDDIVGSKKLSAATRSLTVRFTWAVDAASVTGESIYLEDAQGQRIPILSTSVEGKEVTLTFDTLPADGDYRLVIGPGVGGTNGVALQTWLGETGQADCRIPLYADVTGECIMDMRWESAEYPSYLDVVLSDAIDPSTVSVDGIQLLTPQGDPVDIASVEMMGDTVMRLYVGGLWEPGDYGLTLPATITDGAGNPLAEGGRTGSVRLKPTTVLVVTSLADDYSGCTLRDACYYADYYGEEENVVITFAEDLYGPIYLEYGIYLDHDVTINNNSSGSVYLICQSGYEGVFWTSSRLTLNNMHVYGSIALSGEGAVLDGAGNYLNEIRLGDFSGSISDVLRLQADSSLSVQIDSLSGDAVLCKLPGDDSSYTLYCHVSSGQTLTVEEDATVWGSVYVESGGTMRLDGARIRGSIYLYSGATLEGEGNVFTSDRPIYLKDWSGSASSALGAFNTLGNSSFESANLQIGVSSLSGDAVLDALPEGFSSYYASGLSINAGQTLTVEEGVTLKGSVDVKSGGTMRLNDARIEASLYLSPGAVLEGAGNVFASDRPIYLEDWSGNASDALAMLDSLENTTFESGNMQIGIYSISGDTVLDALPEGFSSYYASWLHVTDGKMMTVKEGVTLTGIVRVRTGGTMSLDGARIEETLYLSPGAILKGAGNVFASECPISLYEWSGTASSALAMLGSLENTAFESSNLQIGVDSLAGKVILDALPEGFSSYEVSWLYVNYDDILTVNEGVTLTGSTYIESSGTLNMKGATYEGSLSIQDGANAVIDSCDLREASLSIYTKSNTQIHNCDLSQTDLYIYSDYYMGGGSSGDFTVIDLSGNWWGTTDEEEIRAKIGGYYDPYNTYVIIDGWLTESPLEKFVVEDLVGSKLLSAADRSLTVCFSQAVDAASVTAETVYLEDAQGRRIPILSTTVEGKEVTITFDTLPADGDYRLVIGPGVMNIHGATLQKQLDVIGQEDYRLGFRADVTAERITSLQWEAADQPSYLDVHLSGAVDPSTIPASGIRLLDPQGAAVGIRRVEVMGDTVIRLYVGELAEPGDYELSLPGTITDNAGNALAEDSRTGSVPLVSSSLSIVAGEVAYDAQVNSDATFPISIANSGNAAEEEVQVKVWLKDAAGNRVLLGTVAVEALAAGETRVLECSLPLAESLNLEEAGYTIVAEVSGSRELPALRADNESAVGTLNVTYPPAADLRITAMGMPETLRAGESVGFQVSVINEGTADAQGPLKLAVYLIPAGGTLSQGVMLGTHQIPDSTISLSPGCLLSFALEDVQIPADIALSGDVQVVAVIDPDGEIDEKPADRADNVYTAPEVLDLPATLTLSVSATEVKEGDSRRVVYTVTRSGSKQNALTVRLSCEQAELLGLPQTLTIAAGQSYTRYQKAVVNNSVYQGDQTVDIAVSAEGYTSSTARLTVLDDELPALTLTLPGTSLAEGGSMTATVSLEVPAQADMVVKLGSSLSGQLTLPASVTIKAGETSADFQITAIDDTTAEIDKTLTITAKADGATTAKAELKVVDDDIPAVQLVLNRTLVSEGDGYAVITATLVRTGNMSEAVTVRLADTNDIGLILPSSIRIGANVKAVNFNIGVVDDSIVNGERTGVITGTLILESCGCSATTSTNGGEIVSVPVTITDNDGPTLSLKLSRTTLREGGSEQATLTVTTNYVTDQDLVVRLSDNSGYLNLPETVVIAAGQSSASVSITAKTDSQTSGSHLSTITAAAEGFTSGTGFIQVTDIDLPDLVVRSVTVDGEAVAGRPLTVSVEVFNQGYAATNKPTVVSLVLQDGTELGTITLDGIVAAGESVTLVQEVTLPPVTGQSHIKALVNSDNSVVELDLTNNTTASAGFNIGAGYEVEVQTDQSVVYTGSPVAITGRLIPTLEGQPVAGQQLKVQVRTARGLMANISVETDAEGNFSTTYTPAEAVVGTYSVSAVVLGENTGTLATFENAGVSVDIKTYFQWDVQIGKPVTGSFTITNTGNVALTNLHVVSDNIPSNISLQLEGMDEVLEVGESLTVNYTVSGLVPTNADQYQKFGISILSDEGYAKNINAYAYVTNLLGDIALSTAKVKENIYFDSTSGIPSVRYVEFTITNKGSGETGLISINLPSVDWMYLYSQQTIASLGFGESATVTLAVDASRVRDIVTNAAYEGSIVVSSENGGYEKLAYSFTFVEEQKASLTVELHDSYTNYADSKAVVATARARLVNAYDSSKTYSVHADENGICSFTEVESGTYYLIIDADGCAQSKTLVRLGAGADVQEAVQLSNQSVSYVWDVEKMEYEEVYNVTQTVDFVTQVPAPDVRITEGITIPQMSWGESSIVTLTVSNYGLIAARDFALTLPQWENFTFNVLDPVDSIAANASHTFHIEVTWGGADTAQDPVKHKWECLKDNVWIYWLEGESDGTYRKKSTWIQTLGDCEEPSTPSKPGEVVWVGGGYGVGGPFVPVNSGGGAPSGSTPRKVVVPVQCVPCKSEVMESVSKCSDLSPVTQSEIISFIDRLPNHLFLDLVTPLPLELAGNVFDIDCANKVLKTIGDCGVATQTLKGFINEVVSAYDNAKGFAESGYRNSSIVLGLGTKSLYDRIMEILGEMEKAMPSGSGTATSQFLTQTAQLAIGSMGARLTAAMALSSITGPFDISFLLMDGSVDINDALAWNNRLMKYIADDNGAARQLTDSEIAVLRNMNFTNSSGARDLLDLYYNAWNRTVLYNQLGIYSMADVERINASGDLSGYASILDSETGLLNTCFFSSEYYAEVAEAQAYAADIMNRNGYHILTDFVTATSGALQDYVNMDASSVCATVKLQFSQSVTMSREAFEGRLTLDNTGGDMTDVSFVVHVVDSNGVDMTDHFEVNYYYVSDEFGIPASSGVDPVSGVSLAANTSGSMYVRFTPGREVAKTETEAYDFTATLSYKDADGTEITMDLTPVTLDVNPSPSLTLHYFLQEDIYSDNPFTEDVEAAHNAQLGVLVQNNGFGAARNYRMSDFTVDYLANEAGLALDFNFVGVSLNGGKMEALGTDVLFGDIAGNSTASAIWYFTTNLQGTFKNYTTSTITRTDSLGNVSVVTQGDEFSLIEDVQEHMLVRSLDADGDGKTDFLVNDDKDALKLGDAIYFGNGKEESVNAVTIYHTSDTLGNGVNEIDITVYVQSGYNHIRLFDPGSGQYVIDGVSVSGSDLDESCFWQTDRDFDGLGSWRNEARLHMLYYAEEKGEVTFTLTYDSVDHSAPKVESISGVENRSSVSEVPEVVVTFSEAINQSTFTAECIELQKNGVEVDPSAITWEWTGDRTLRLTNLDVLAAGDSLYTLTVNNKGLQDVFGNAGIGDGKQLQWTMAAESLSIRTMKLVDVRQGKDPVATVQISFSKAVSNFNKSHLYVSCLKDGVVTYVEDLSGVGIRQADESGCLYEVTGLDRLQGSDGDYLIGVNAENLYAADGTQAVATAAGLRWTLCRTAPTLLDTKSDVSPNTFEQARKVLFTFDHEIAQVDSGSLHLLCNGVESTAYILTAEVDAGDATKVVVTLLDASGQEQRRGLRGAGDDGSALQGEWSLQMDLGGVTDIYGNVGDGKTAATWELDSVAPDAVQTITLNGKETRAVADASVTLGMTLPEAGLKVTVYAASMTASSLGTKLWSGTVENTDFSETLALPYDGAQKLNIVLEDAAGNTTTCDFQVMVDAYALGLRIKAEEKYTQAPESISLVFTAAVDGLTMDALSLTCNGAAVDTAGLTLTQVGDTEWALGGLDSAMLENGAYTVSVDLSQLTKVSSGLAGKGSVSAAFTMDSVTSVEVVGSNVVSKPGSVESLGVSFSTDINYAELSASGLLPQAVRLVNQETGETVLLDAAGFSYAGNEITWAGTAAVPAGQYAVVVDAALVTAANGAPLNVGGNAGTGVVGFGDAATLLGAMGDSYTAPYAVDWNGDGLVDLLVGEKTAATGKVRVYLNQGTATAPVYTGYTYLQADGADLSVAASGCQGVVVALQDLNGDGSPDLVAGLSDGKVVYYLADGAGSFGAQQQLAVSVGSRAFPTFFDWDGDGTADLVIGAGDGSIHYAAATVAEDGSLTFGALKTVDGITVSGRAAPVFADVNGDGRTDVIVGDADGNLSLYYAADGGYSLVKTWTLDGVDWERTRPTAADLNGDGKTDIIVGGSSGNVYVLYGQDNAWSGTPVTVEPLPQLSAVQLAAEGGTLTVTWDVADVPEGAVYKVQISAAGDFSDAVEYTGDASGTLLVGDVADGTYTARVRIIMPNGVAGEWLGSDIALVDTTAPAIPAGLTAQADGPAIAFAWGGVQDPSGVHYEIRYSQKADFAEANVREVTDNAFGISGLADGTWYWQVRAVDGKGNASAWADGGSLEVDTAVVIHWAEGVTGNSGYYDVNKSGTAADNNLCWAAASSNVLAWWQQTYGTADTTHIGVATSAQDIYGTMQQNWKNVSGCEFNGFVWWLDSAACTDETYLGYADANLIGSDGSYYSAYFNGENLATQVVENTLKGAGKSEVAARWSELFAAGAGMTLGVYKNATVSGTLLGGHAVSLWGFDCSHADNTLTRIYVTDSDDGVDALVSLDVSYDTAAGLYRVDASGSKLDGCYLGNYTYLAAPAEDLFASVPAAPAGLNIMTPGKNIDFDWNAVSGAATYTLQYVLEDGDYADAVTISGLTYDIYELALKPGKVEEGTYKWRVRAVGSNGELSAWSEGSAFLVDLSVGQVEGVKASVSSNALGATVTLTWDAVTDISGISHYSVQYSTSADFANAKSSTAKTFVMKDGYNYYCHVNAHDKLNNVGEWSETVVIINSGTAQAGENGALLSWLAVENAGGYAVRCATDAGFAEYDTYTVGDASLNLEGLLSGTDYYWSVVALDGNGRLMGDWSYAGTFATQVNIYNDTPADTQSVLVLQEDDTKSVIRATVEEYVGADDPEDYFRVHVDQTGTYDLGLDLDALGNPVYLSVGTLSGSDYQVISTVLVPASGAGAGSLKNILLQGGTDYYVRVSTTNGAAGGYNGAYTLSMQTEKVADNRITADNTMETATRPAWQNEDTAGFGGWIGVGDEVDIYRIELEQAGTLRVNLDNLDYQAKLQVYQVENGEISSFLNRTVRTNGLDKELSVSAGTYYVQVSTVGSGSSRYNTAYTLDIETDIDGTRKQGVLAAV